MTTTNELTVLLDVARETAVTAGKQVRAIIEQPRTITDKGHGDIATDADFAAQTLIINTILARFPHHGFLAEEENAPYPTKGPIIWIVDPLDGTQNYNRRQPEFAVSVAAARPLPNNQFQPLAGAIYDPMRDELFSAASGMGAFKNDHPITVSPIHQLNQSVLAVDWSYNPSLGASMLNHALSLGKAVKSLRALGSAALCLAWVAAGRYDAYINFHLKPWDIAAAVVIVAEAGGKVTHLDGTPLQWHKKGLDCLFSNGRLHTQYLQHLHYL